METLSSSSVSRVQEERHIQDSLRRNGYPIAFITKHTHMLEIHWGKTNTTVVSRKPMECNFEVEKSIVWIV